MKNYWRMSTAELEKEAEKHHISEYYKDLGGLTVVSRKDIIEQLLVIENARNMSISHCAMIISLFATAVNVSLTIANIV